MTTTSSTGGRIIQIPGGLIHYGRTDHLLTDSSTTVTVRGTGQVGRPTKISVEEGLKFDFSAFMSPVKLTSSAGRVVKFK
jgi:hypothetical protein